MININCQQKRNIFNLLKIYTCSDCQFLFDEWFYLGKNVIYICHIGNTLCEYIKEDFLNENKIWQIFYEYMLYSQEVILFWIDDLNFESYFDIIDKLVDNNLNIIFITK